MLSGSSASSRGVGCVFKFLNFLISRKAFLRLQQILSKKKYLSGDRAYLLWSAVSANICFLIGDYPRPKSHGPGALSSFAKNSEN